MTNNSQHASGKRPRQVAGWVIAFLLIVVVIIAVTVSWALVNKNADTVRTEEAIEDCSAGYVSIDIWAPEDIQNSLTALITDYQATLATDGGLCSSFSISAQPSAEVAKEILAPDAYLPGIWIGQKSDVTKVVDKYPSYIVTKPEALKGTDYVIITFDMAKNDPVILDEVTAEHPEEATQAAAEAETYIKDKGVSIEKEATE